MKLQALLILVVLLFLTPTTVNAGGAVPPANIKMEKAECGQPYKDSAMVEPLMIKNTNFMEK